MDPAVVRPAPRILRQAQGERPRGRSPVAIGWRHRRALRKSPLGVGLQPRSAPPPLVAHLDTDYRGSGVGRLE